MKITVRAELDFDSIDYLCLDDFDGNKYIEGIGFKANNTLIVLENGDEFPIKPNTRSINLDDMLDSQGNKIFASLNEDGKGGDVLNSGYGEVIIAIYEEGMIKFRFEEALPYNHTTIDKIDDEDFLSFYEVWQIRDKLESEVIGIKNE